MHIRAGTIHGTLAEDVECIDVVFRRLDEDEGDIVRINGWLWCVEVVPPEADPLDDFNYFGSRHHY
ncbi:hypothetical protein G3545_06265 [Starkeya sp. ORNL1]|uniref:hypothetical protein n=1 Tax=Starkeya sp. ORNL1 TaxID=2709380 RepID=UPI0014631FA8|nr:hypothetical protein [Starkeya sp. ORNL1]QJP13289.1 hypothetical protein G3545_06265 [Starkeya sp. ORNL1]